MRERSCYLSAAGRLCCSLIQSGIKREEAGRISSLLSITEGSRSDRELRKGHLSHCLPPEPPGFIRVRRAVHGPDLWGEVTSEAPERLPHSSIPQTGLLGPRKLPENTTSPWEIKQCVRAEAVWESLGISPDTWVPPLVHQGLSHCRGREGPWGPLATSRWGWQGASK